MGNSINSYKTEWTDNDNIVLFVDLNGFQVGIVEICIFKQGERKGEAYIWNLHVIEVGRMKGYGSHLIKKAIKIAKDHGCTRATLEWDIRDSPYWVYDWYTRLGFEEKKFGKGCAWMEKKL